AFLQRMKNPLIEAAARATRAFGEDASMLEQAARKAEAEGSESLDSA
ncbi:IclR family transcriptional regulator, partial [Mesorhizobium sp. M6A.T.Ca.TU.002.02.2.1]